MISLEHIKDKKNKWLIRIDDGGYSPCIKGKPEYFKGSVLANCVGLCWGVVAELLNDKKCKIGCTKNGVKPQSAQYWYRNAENTKLFKVGKTPKPNAVACWIKNDGKSGHVAIVLEVKGSDIKVIESGYNHYDARINTYKKGVKDGYKLQGYIYIDVKPTPNENKDKDVIKLGVGDTVKIIGKGNGHADGKGIPANGVGYIRTILRIYPKALYPYQVGNKKATTGFYKANALKKM